MEQKKEFPWGPTWNAPKLYPAELIYGVLMCDKGPVSIIGGYGGEGWGAIGGLVASGVKSKPLPKELYVRWYSFTEDKFYEGNFILPYDRILELFKEGFISRTKAKSTFHDFIIGFAPGGRVAVWLIGYGKQVEIGIYQAEECEYMDVDDFLQGQYYYTRHGQEGIKEYRMNILKSFDGSIENLEQNGIPFGRWDLYRERYLLRPVVIYEDSTCITDEIYMKFLNGENETLSLELLKNNEFQPRARIKHLEIDWSFGQMARRVEIKFDEKEIFDIYKNIYKENPNEPVELQICLNRENNCFEVFFVCMGNDSSQRIQVRHAQIGWYPLGEHERSYFEVFKQSK